MEVDPQPITTAEPDATTSSGSLPRDPVETLSRETVSEITPAEEILQAEVPGADSSLPVPSGPLRGQQKGSGRTSLWKRIKMRTRGQQADAQAALVTARLDAIERQIGGLEVDTRDRFNALSQRLDEVWECEEQLSLLSELQERAERVTQSQSEVGEALNGISRKLGALTRAVVALGVLAIASLLAAISQF